MKKVALSLLNQKDEVCHRTFLLISCLVFFISSFFAVQNVSAQQCQPPATPALTATAGPRFQQITLSWTGVQGSNGYYQIYGAPNGGSFGDPLGAYVATGQSITNITNSWGINALLDTNQTYNYYWVYGS